MDHAAMHAPFSGHVTHTTGMHRNMCLNLVGMAHVGVVGGMMQQSVMQTQPAQLSPLACAAYCCPLPAASCPLPAASAAGGECWVLALNAAGLCAGGGSTLAGDQCTEQRQVGNQAQHSLSCLHPLMTCAVLCMQVMNPEPCLKRRRSVGWGWVDVGR